MLVLGLNAKGFAQMFLLTSLSLELHGWINYLTMIFIVIISSRAGESATVYHQVTVPDPNAKGFPQPLLLKSLSL